MPKATRYSPSYERRRSHQYRTSSSASESTTTPMATTTTTNNTTTTSSSSHSMRYLRGRVSSSLHSPRVAAPISITSESYLRIKKKGALTTWSTRYMVMRGEQLVWFQNKQDAQYRRGMLEIQYIKSGQLTTLRSHELGLEVHTTDGREFVARTFDRSDLAKWITAFQRLALKREAKLAAGGRLSEALTADSTATGESYESEPLELKCVRRCSVEPELVDKTSNGSGRHVSFHHSVLVRTIPTVSDDQIPELFYSREDMEKFSARASSIFSRTEEAVSCAYSAIRLPSSMSCRRDVSCRRGVA